MKILEKTFKVEPVPQGNRTVRFRWALEQGEQISKVAVPFVYVTKDHWRTAMGHATTALLEVDILPENQKQISNPNKYVWDDGQTSLMFLHFDVSKSGVSRREMNSIHPIPLVYIQAAWWAKHGGGQYAIIRLLPIVKEW